MASKNKDWVDSYLGWMKRANSRDHQLWELLARFLVFIGLFLFAVGIFTAIFRQSNIAVTILILSFFSLTFGAGLLRKIPIAFFVGATLFVGLAIGQCVEFYRIYAAGQNLGWKTVLDAILVVFTSICIAFNLLDKGLFFAKEQKPKAKSNSL